ncbi:MAG: signal peptidase [Sphingomonadales bacterium]|jgi:signal peptidase I|nr:signal peptidase [Sphingomonadales bacterium]
MSPALRRVAWGTAVGICAVIALAFALAVAAFGSGYFKNFYLPSEAMAPTLEKGDHFIAYMEGGGELKRGQIVLVAVGRSTYVKRLAALPGDTIGLAQGIVILNGRPVPQRLLKEERRGEVRGAPLGRRLTERFPGELAAHEILDMGPSEVDDFPARRIPAGHVFVLGDHRDRSADSRVPRAADGVDLLPIADIKGHALWQTGPRAKFGLELNP